jgi:hypothetical protein
MYAAKLAILLATLGSLCFSSTAHAQFSFQTDRFGYTGDVTVYGTLADAQNQVNAASGPHAAPQRDLALYFNDIAYSPTVAFETAWYYTTQAGPAYSGAGNPNNSNFGLLQFNDQLSTTSYTANGFWSSLNANVVNGSQFTLTANGTNASYLDVFARLWPAPLANPTSVQTGGTFISWELLAVADGLTATYTAGTPDPGDEGYEALNHPTNVTGHLRGIFENPNVPGFYRYDFTMNMTNWAFTNQGSLNGTFYDSYFFAVPEPSSALLFGLALLPAAFRRRRG